MQSPEFDMKAQQTRREGQTRQESTPGREVNVNRNNAHGNLVPEAEKREPENEVVHMVDINLACSRLSVVGDDYVICPE